MPPVTTTTSRYIGRTEPAASSNDGEEDGSHSEEAATSQLDEAYEENDATRPRDDSPPAEHLSPEERLEQKRQVALAAQKVQETQALGRNSFCKDQRVLYLHKASGRYFEAFVVDVHFDDGIDRPYFTVRYEFGDEEIEKQTTSDRLSYVGFDEAKTYRIIASKIRL